MRVLFALALVALTSALPTSTNGHKFAFSPGKVVVVDPSGSTQATIAFPDVESWGTPWTSRIDPKFLFAPTANNLAVVVVDVVAGQVVDKVTIKNGHFDEQAWFEGVLRPVEISYNDLKDPQDLSSVLPALMKALSTEGVVAMTDVPKYSLLRPQTLQDAFSCIETSDETVETELDDGTIRRSLGTATSLVEGSQKFPVGDSPGCQAFEKSSTALRRIVDDASLVFADALTALLDGEVEGQLLKVRGKNDDYETVSDVVEHGDHLDHFHAYRAPSTQSSSDATDTIEFHTDQGLFIAMTAPFVLARDGSPSPASAGKFLVRTPEGQQQLIYPANSLIFVLGDGVEQIVNGKSDLQLRSAPHSLSLDWSTDDTTRMWFGRMFLPPVDAVSDEHGVTYGALRKQANAANWNEGDEFKKAASVACSRRLMPRRLSAELCSEDSQIFCWSRCMDFHETANPDFCASKNLGFNCTHDVYDELYVSGHGSFNPRCTNSTTPLQFRSSALPDSQCEFALDKLVADSKYTHMMNLTNPPRFGKGPGHQDNTLLLWKLNGEKIEATFVQEGPVGWLSIGAAYPGGGHNGMNGAWVVLGVVEEEGGEASIPVNEYQIDLENSRFSFWSTPKPNTLDNKEMSVTECGTTITFHGDAISGHPLNITGSNKMLWGVNQLAYGVWATHEGDDYLEIHTTRGVFDWDVQDDTYAIGKCRDDWGACVYDYETEEILVPLILDESSASTVQPWTVFLGLIPVCSWMWN